METVATDKSASAECDARLLVDWGELPQVGRHARPLFSLIATAAVGKPSVRIQIDRSLDSDPNDPLRQPQLEEDGLWTFTVPFSLTSNGVDAKPGLYIIDVEVTFPHTADHHPRFLRTRIRLKIPDASNEQRELVIDGDGQSVVNLAGQDLRSFSKVVLKGDDRGIINIQNFDQSQNPTDQPERPVVFEYELKINREIHDRLPRLVEVSKQSKTDAITLVIGKRRVHVIARKRATFGRGRDNDICLRFWPRTAENDEGSRGISKTHAAISLSDDGLVLTDEGSTHGLDVDCDPVKGEHQLTHVDARGTRQFDLPSPLSSAKLTLEMELDVLGRDPDDPNFQAAVEWDDVCFETAGESPSRLWHVAKDCGIESARIRRVSNLEDEEYIFLYRHATMGRSARDHAISLPIGNVTGELRLVFAGRMFWLHSTGATTLAIDGDPIEGPCLVPLIFGHCLSINGIDVHVTRLSQFHLHDDPVLRVPSVTVPPTPPPLPSTATGAPPILPVSAKKNQKDTLNESPAVSNLADLERPPSELTPDSSIVSPDSDDTTDPIAAALSSVAVITGNEGHGSGFLIYPDVLVTNYHVVADDPVENLNALFFDPITHEQMSLPVSLLSEDPSHDLAFLSIDTALPPLNLREQFDHRNGHRVAVIGSPGIGDNGDRLENVVSDGRLGPEYSSLIAPDRWSLSITLNPGNSGGPVLDAETGDVLGVTVAKFTTVDGLALAVPNEILVGKLSEAVNTKSNADENNSKHRQRYCLRKFASFASAVRTALDEFTCQYDEVSDGTQTISSEGLVWPFLDKYGEAVKSAIEALDSEVQPELSKLRNDGCCSQTVFNELDRGRIELTNWEDLLSSGQRNDSHLAALDEISTSLTTIESICGALQLEIEGSLLNGRSVFENVSAHNPQTDRLQPVAMGGLAVQTNSKTILSSIVLPRTTPKPRYLTKSRFTLACSCPTKLFYTAKTREYANSRSKDPIMQSLANEGNRVGALAQLYFPEGHLVKTLNHEAALSETNELLAREEVTIFEAAIRADDLFIRADILRKSGDSIHLLEVKSKCYSEKDDGDLTTASGIASAWLPYVRDIAFQKHVLARAFPESLLRAFLFLPNKEKSSPSSELATKCFRATDGEDVSLTQEEQASPLMQAISVDKLCDIVQNEQHRLDGRSLPFSAYADTLAEAYREDRKCLPVLSTACLNCEFDTNDFTRATGIKSGRHECWTQLLGWSESDFNKPLAFEIGGLSSAKKQMLLNERRLHIDEVSEDDIDPSDDGKPGLSLSQRQWVQVKKSIDGETASFFDRDGLREEMATWEYPLHFIDFETCRPVIPFHAGSRPSSLIAFQFSHHIMNADGSVKHANEFLCTELGKNPNANFISAISEAIGDTGTVLHYAPHEISTLRAIAGQLRSNYANHDDTTALLTFIDTIAPRSDQEASRSAVDICRLVKRFYYAPSMRGSNSIKDVLPAILNESKFLKERYSHPIYGSANGIPSRNFQNMTWVETTNGTVQDPYSLLPASGAKDDAKPKRNVVIRNGGSAMQAYADLQFCDWPEQKREATQQSLLRYCELDTLAMVFIVEAWQDWCS